MIPLSLLLCTLSAQQPTAPQVSLAKTVDVGHLRHVHWLTPRGDELRWATAALSGVFDRNDRELYAHARTAPSSVVEVRSGNGALEARLEVPFRLLQEFTWTERPTWRVMELDGGTWVACVDVQEKQLHVYDLGDGREVAPARPASALHDSRLVAGGAELLVEVEGGLECVSLRPGADSVVTAGPLATGLETLGAAAFVTSLPGAATTTVFDVWSAGWTAEGLALSRVRERGEGTEGATTFPVAFAAGAHNGAARRIDAPRNGTALRIDAVRSGDRTWLALGDPGHDSGVGRVLVAEVVEGVVAVRHAGRMDPDVIGDTSDQREWGQCVVFVPDADEDGVPDLAVAGPWTYMNVHVDLVSTARWARLGSYVPGFAESCGHWLDLSHDGKLLLVGGTVQRDYPENLCHSGLLFVLSARDLVRQSRVQLAPVVRSR